MKRFTETAKWDDPWFMDLPAKWKLFWLYLLDNCDNSGVWHPNMRLASFQVGESFESSEALRIFSDRIKPLDSGKWHIVKFVEYQYGQLSENCKPHQQVIGLMEKHGIERVYKGYTKGIHTLQDKDKDKDQLKEKDQDHDPRKPPCTIEQAQSAARECGVMPEQCQQWWDIRSRDGWLQHKSNGTSHPITKCNWRHDLATAKSWRVETKKPKSGFKSDDLTL